MEITLNNLKNLSKDELISICLQIQIEVYSLESDLNEKIEDINNLKIKKELLTPKEIIKGAKRNSLGWWIKRYYRRSSQLNILKNNCEKVFKPSKDIKDKLGLNTRCYIPDNYSEYEHYRNGEE